jgi:hypothetical protein
MAREQLSLDILKEEGVGHAKEGWLPKGKISDRANK